MCIRDRRPIIHSVRLAVKCSDDFLLNEHIKYKCTHTRQQQSKASMYAADFLRNWRNVSTTTVYVQRKFIAMQSVFTARRLAKRGICRRRVSVCLCVCVCVSVTLRYCIKTAKRRITHITPHNSPLTLVFWLQSSLRNSNGITPYGGGKCRWGGLKFVTFDESRTLTRKRYKIDI